MPGCCSSNCQWAAAVSVCMIAWWTLTIRSSGSPSETSATRAPADSNARATSTTCCRTRGAARSRASRTSAQSGWLRLRLDRERRHRLVDAGRIERVVASHGRQEHGAVVHAPRQDAGVIEAPGQRKHATLADAAVGWLEADDTVVGGGAQHRAGGLAAERDRDRARRHARRRATARAAGRPLRGPRVARRRRIGEGELRGDHLAQHDPAGAFESGDGFGVGARDAIGVGREASRGAQPGRVEDVFDAEGDAVQRRQWCSFCVTACSASRAAVSARSGSRVTQA